jgi:hypothetical protein
MYIMSTIPHIIVTAVSLTRLPVWEANVDGIQKE